MRGPSQRGTQSAWFSAKNGGSDPAESRSEPPEVGAIADAAAYESAVSTVAVGAPRGSSVVGAQSEPVPRRECPSSGKGRCDAPGLSRGVPEKHRTA